MNSKRIVPSSLFGAVLVAYLATPAALPAERVRKLTSNCETALALSAAPANVQAKAGVYLLGAQGYELARKSENGFLCLVERNHPDAIIPQCFDAASRDANLQAILDDGRELRRGKSFAELRERRQAALGAGDYPSAGPGLVYMISDYNIIYNPRREGLILVAPHVMYHAPNLSNADIGSDMSVALANRGLPFVNAEGPHGFMIGFTEHGSDSSAIERACAGQLPDRATLPTFP